MRSIKDYMILLEPERELALRHVFGLVEKDPAIYGLVIDIGQRLGGDECTECGIDDRVGAWDVTMIGAMRRGVGEAVERYVLRPPSPGKGAENEDSGLLENIPTDTARFEVETSTNSVSCCQANCQQTVLTSTTAANISHPRISEAARLPEPDENTLWMPANRVHKLTTGKIAQDIVLVDADWINLPTSEQAQQRNWFGTPSGAAAHDTIEGALDSSIRELIERDNITRAWNQLVQAEKIESITGNCLSASKLNKLLRSAPIHLYRIKSQIKEFYTYMAWCVGDDSAAAGSSVNACSACAALHAAIESKQVSALLSEIQTTTDSKILKDPAEVSNFAELSAKRTNFWGSLEGILAWESWDAAAIKSTTVHVDEHPNVKLTSRDIADEGLTHIWVDLTRRLPARVAKRGFWAVKSIIPELLALPMSEGEPWNMVPGGKPFTKWEPLL